MSGLPASPVHGSGSAGRSSIAALTEAYRSGQTTPSEIVDEVADAVQAQGADGTWIEVASRDALHRRAAALERQGERSLPLYGVPFAVKDSIDVQGWPTTLACPGYAYTASETAPAVARLLAAGGILVGKTNLDQFATGLNGTRTPYPIPRSVFGNDLIAGGSSSGSARAVALGEVPFALATDTAGSGRVPPALNGVPGYKPTRGLISTVGLVPACRSLDCMSLIASSVADLSTVLDVVAAPDRRDPWSRSRLRRSTDLASVRVGLPHFAELEFFGDQPMAEAHRSARECVADRMRVVRAPLEPFIAAGELLYAGPWVAERLVQFGDFLAEHPAAVLPVIAEIIGGADRYRAVDVFRAQYRLAELRASTDELFDTTMDVLIVPTVGTTFTVEQVLADPIRTNTMLGHYTHCGNLLDLCAATVPAGVTADGRPAGLMILGPALADDLVLAVAARLSEAELPSSAVTLLPA